MVCPNFRPVNLFTKCDIQFQRLLIYVRYGENETQTVRIGNLVEMNWKDQNSSIIEATRMWVMEQLVSVGHLCYGCCHRLKPNFKDLKNEDKSASLPVPETRKHTTKQSNFCNANNITMKDSSFGRKLKLTSTWLHNMYFVWLAVNSQFQTTQFSS